MNKDKFLQTGLLEQFVLGLTDEEETAVVKQYAQTYPDVQAEIEQMREALDEYARQYAVMPPEELKSRVMKGVDEAEQQADRSDNQPGPSGTGTNWLGVVMLISVIALAAFFYQGKNTAEQQLSSLETRYAALQEACDEDKAAAQQQGQIYATLNHEATVPVRLEATGLQPDAHAVAYLNTFEKKAYINAAMLPEPPTGKTYQLWADVHGEMINMGILDHKSAGLQAVTYIDEAESLNVTIEPQGGSEAPTVAFLIVNGEV